MAPASRVCGPENPSRARWCLTAAPRNSRGIGSVGRIRRSQAAQSERGGGYVGPSSVQMSRMAGNLMESMERFAISNGDRAVELSGAVR